VHHTLNPYHHHHHHSHGHVPIYAAPPSISSGYLTNARMYTMPHSYQSNFYQDYYHTTPHSEKRSPNEKKSERRRKMSMDDELNNSYTGADRDLADSYLKSIENRDQHM
jgi:hypothetical protein